MTTPRVLALDLSLAATGIAHPNGDLSTWPPRTKNDERLHEIGDAVRLMADIDNPDLIALETPFVGANASTAMKLGMLQGAVRFVLLERHLPYLPVTPAVLKTYATGGHLATKADMRMDLYKRTGQDVPDDNQVDAAWLRLLTLDLLGIAGTQVAGHPPSGPRQTHPTGPRVVTVTLYIGDVHERLREIPDHSVDFCCCSPPSSPSASYLPDGHPQKHQEIGSEATPADCLDTLLAFTAEWRRILAPHGGRSPSNSATPTPGPVAPAATTEMTAGRDGQLTFKQQHGSPPPTAAAPRQRDRRHNSGHRNKNRATAPAGRSTSPCAASPPYTLVPRLRPQPPHRAPRQPRRPMAHPQPQSLDPHQPPRRRPGRQRTPRHLLHHRRLHCAPTAGSTWTPSAPPPTSSARPVTTRSVKNALGSDGKGMADRRRT